jgi:hypothetical protein
VNISRPVTINHIHFIDTTLNPVLELPLNRLTDDAWARIPLKTITSPYPTAYYYNPTFPLGTINFWPVPTNSGLQGSIYYLGAIQEFTSTTQNLTPILPPSYRRMIVSNLALELIPEYGADVSPSTAALVGQQAMNSMAVVKRNNVEMADLAIDQGALGHGVDNRFGYWIYSGP